MRARKKLLAILGLLVTIILAGCGVSGTETIDEIPTDARKVTTIDLTGKTGTFMDGKIGAWTDGYIILDVKLQSGTVNTIEIVNVTQDEVIDSVKKPKKGIYDSVIYGYRSGREYKLNFINSKNLTGSVDVYFVNTYD